MCSIRIQTSVRWLTPALLAVTLMCSLTAQAEPTGVVAATPAASDSRDVQAELGLSPRSAQGEVSGYAGRRLGWRNTRVKREEERLRFREAAAASWRYSGRWATGLILGVGF